MPQNGWRGPREGEIWFNKNMAATFREIAEHGQAQQRCYSLTLQRIKPSHSRKRRRNCFLETLVPVTAGKDGFYKGRVAKAIVKVLADMGGVMTEADLAGASLTLQPEFVDL